jgi:hypothetical protein
MHGAHFSVFVIVVRVRPSGSTRNEHDWQQAVERNKAVGVFSAAS